MHACNRYTTVSLSSQPWRGWCLKTSFTSCAKEQMRSLELELVVDVWRVLRPNVAGDMYIGGLVLLHPALLVAPKSVPCQIGILLVEVALRLCGLLRCCLEDVSTRRANQLIKPIHSDKSDIPAPERTHSPTAARIAAPSPRTPAAPAHGSRP